MINQKIIILLALNLLGSWSFFKKDVPIKKIAEKVMLSGIESKDWPEHVEVDKSKYYLNYTFDSKLEGYIKKELKRYRPDYASVVVIENKSGRILSAIDYSKKSKTFGSMLTLSSTHPAASLFKIVSSVELLSKKTISVDQEFLFRGKSTTLYKWQLKKAEGRWIRKSNLKKAFSRSNNVIFGKAAQQYSTGQALYKTAEMMGIEHDILQLLILSSPQVMMPTDKYQLAEMASGFNKKTMISPVHAAVMVGIIANNGVLHKPYIVSDIRNSKENVYSAKLKAEKRIPLELAMKMKAMMVNTVDKGTARSIFRRRSRTLKKIIVGGKTGTLTGGIPLGKRDWFACFAYPEDQSDAGISVAVMMINVDKWFVRSTQLAKTIINYYFQENLKGK